MFVERKSKIQKNTEKESTSLIDNELVDSPILPTDDKIRNFKQQTIKVLNLLEQEGIDIYSEGRYGGMYLRNSDESKKIENVFKKLSSIQQQKRKKTEEKNNTNTTKETSSTENIGLLQFLKNKHKQQTQATNPII